MIAALRGTIDQKNTVQVVVDVGGVGYEVFVPNSTYTGLPGLGESVYLFIQTIVREDAIVLYGFATAEEKELFVLLIGVSGIGPKLALTVLGGLGGPTLRRAIGSKDVIRLTSISGVGKRIAERLCMELAEKIGNIGSGAGDVVGAKPVHMVGSGASAQGDAVSALVNLGYPEQVAWQTLRLLEKEQGDDKSDHSLEEWLRLALRHLAMK